MKNVANQAQPFKQYQLQQVNNTIKTCIKQIITYLIWLVFNRSLFWIRSCSSFILWKI